jgi:hypothetical protein
MLGSSISSLFAEGDTSATQGSEFYLYEQRQQQKLREKEERRRERNKAELKDYACRFYRSNWKGKDAVICKIIEAQVDPPKADYAVSLIERTQQAMTTQDPPEDLPVSDIVNTDNSFRRAVLKAYNEAVTATHGKQGTQLGETQAHYSGVMKFETFKI